MPTSPPLACPICSALLLPGATNTHVEWHAHTRTLDGWTTDAAARSIKDNAAAVAALATDDTPTAKLPPYRETVLRRPPAAEVRELKGRELLLALAAELADDQDADGPEECQAAPSFTGNRMCTWPKATPCLAYGADGCGMKAQES